MFLLTAKDARIVTDLVKRNKRPMWAKTLRNYPIIFNDEEDVLWNAINREDYNNFYFSTAQLKSNNKMNLKNGYSYKLEEKSFIAESTLNKHIRELDEYFAKNIKWGINHGSYFVKFPFYDGDFVEDDKFFQTFLALYGYKVNFIEEKNKKFIKVEW